MMSGKIPDFVAMRLNSILKQVYELEHQKNQPSLSHVEIIWNTYAELHQNILKNMESQLGEYFPDYEPHNIEYGELLLELTKTRIRELADHFLLKLDIDQTNSSPNTIVTQNQFVSQSNVQTLSNLIDNVNALQIPDSDKEQIIALVKEFEKESKDKKEPTKLRNIMFKVASLSIDAGSFLLKHANEIHVLKDILL